MEENKVATDSELMARAERLVKELYANSVHPHYANLIFRELIAVRDQAAKYTTAEEWKRMHSEVTHD